MKRCIPWGVKFLVKIITGVLGLNTLLHKAAVYSHGEDSIERHFSVFSKHFECAQGYLSNKNFTVLELGPGYSLATAVFATRVGAQHTYLVEEGSYARESTKDDARAFLQKRDGQSYTDVNYTYLTEGIESLKEIPDHSVDYIFSNSVLEHVRKEEMLPLLTECKRILKPSGVCSHWVDLKDHLGASLHSLRFSEKFWEGKLIRRAGFYTNRLRYSELLTVFEQAGFNHAEIEVRKFETPIISRSKFDTQFRNLSDKDVLISGCHVLLFPL